MADEITVTIGLKVVNGNLNHLQPLANDLVTQTTRRLVSKVESIPTTAGGTVIDLSALVANGWCYVKNLDATNFIKIGPTSGGAIVDFIKLKAAEQAVFRIHAGVSMRIIADTAACLVYYAVYDD